MQLNFQERTALLELLPQKEDYAGMKEIQRAREELSISGEEVKKYGEKQEDGNYRIAFAKTVGAIKEIPMGEWLTEKIRDLLRKKNEKHDLEDKFISLFEKFVVNYQQY